jgi:hypothetical protein
MDLKCPYCGSGISVEVSTYEDRYYGAHTEVVIECFNTTYCGAAWDANGDVVREGKTVPVEPPMVPDTEPSCEALSPRWGFTCTIAVGHTYPEHLAHTDPTHIVHRWPVDND